MKKRITVVVSVLIIAVVIVSIITYANRKPTMTGRAIVSGSTILITDESDCPVQLNPKTEKVFQNITIHTGDLIQITFDGYFQYSSPAQTTIYKVCVLKLGSISDVPDRVIKMLENYKWPID